MSINLVTIKTFDDSFSANILKNKLESEGIICFLFDENIVTLNPLYNYAVGGVKLKVEKDSANQALLIIDELENKPITDVNNDQIQCPKCSSVSLYTNFRSIKGVKGILSTLIAFIFMVLPLYIKTINKCKDCGAEFK